MTTILLVTGADSVRNRVHTSLAGTDVTIIDHTDPKTAAATAYELPVDAVVVDMQVAAMGAMAITRSIRAAAGDGGAIPVTVLLDREADAFLAKRAGATNWLSKNREPSELRAAIGAA